MTQSKDMKIRIHCPKEYMPRYQTAGAAGCDLVSVKAERLRSGAGVEGYLVSTGVHIELPHGYEAQVRPRSYWNKEGLLVQLGTIDSDYRGEIKVVVWNLFPYGTSLCQFPMGVRIAQLVIAPVVRAEFARVELDELTQTERGTNGFGSTGE